MEFIKKNKKMVIIIAVALVIIILLFGIIKSLMPDTRKSVWGTRTVDVSKHPISDEEISAVKEFYESNENVVNITYRLSGRKMIFIITVKEKTAKSVVEELSGKMLEKLSDDVKGFYDIELSYVCEDSENAEYPIMAYRNKTRHNFRFTYAG
nr:hypothetical protein [Bacilli bacterium]